MNRDKDCVFCQRIADGEYDSEYNDCVVFAPLNPVTTGHLLVVPKSHFADASADVVGAGKAVEVASLIARGLTFYGDPPWAQPNANIIINIGKHASQTIMHTHIHVVPRTENDGLKLPWTDQKKKE